MAEYTNVEKPFLDKLQLLGLGSNRARARHSARVAPIPNLIAEIAQVPSVLAEVLVYSFF